jgi:NADP-dependent 3-hydroxy acid dehydrogenase YdfG
MAPLTWLVTGCSSGFGECYISSITARGDRVIATARNPEKIAHLQGPNVRVLRLDISSPQEEIDKTVAEALSLFNRIDVLVNNAGYIQGGPVEQVRYLHSQPSHADIDVRF